MTDHVELSMPARPDLLVLARLTAGAVGARAELPVDDVEDLRLAIDELCLSLVGPHGDRNGRLELRYSWDREGIEVSCTLHETGGTPDSGASPSSRLDGGLPEDLAQRILDALVDEHGQSVTDGHPHAWLRKRRTTPG